MVGLISPLRLVAGTRFESMVPLGVGHRPYGHEGPEILGALERVVMACCPGPFPLGAVQLVPRSATQCHGGKGGARTRGCACSPTYTTPSAYGGES